MSSALRLPRQLLRDRLVVLVVAFFVRAVVAWVFFGSVDATNCILNSARLFAGWSATQIPVPYFPGIQLFLWTGGIVAVYTPLPLTFVYKIFGGLFDAVLALAIHDRFAADRTRALRAGLLYAFAPVPLIIVSIHAQWDSISLLFLILSFFLVARQTPATSGMAGVCYVLSVVVKPIAVPFLFLLFPAPWVLWRSDEAAGHRRRAAALIGGAAAAIILYLSVMAWLGQPVGMGRVRTILDYASEGVFVAGLPKLLGVRPYRFLSLAPLVLLVPMYWKNVLTRERVALLTFALLLGTSNSCAQYLIWVVPFLLLTGNERFAAWYNVLAGLFLIIHYSHPGPDLYNFHNLGAFAPLRSVAWLAPAATHLSQKTFLYLFLGSVAVPVSCLLFSIVDIWRALGSGERSEDAAPSLAVSHLMAPAAAALLIVAGAAGYAWSVAEPTLAQFTSVVREKVRAYDIRRYRGPGLYEPDEPTWVIRAYAQESPRPRARAVDAVSIGYAWVVGWSLAAWLAARRPRGDRDNLLAHGLDGPNGRGHHDLSA